MVAAAAAVCVSKLSLLLSLFSSSVTSHPPNVGHIDDAGSPAFAVQQAMN